MKATRREWIGAAMSAAASAQVTAQQTGAGTRYVRFRTGSTTAHGLLEGETIRTIVGDLFGTHKLGASHKLSSVKLLCPVVAPKVMAVGLNYRSHLGSATPPKRPEIFFKPVTCLIDPAEPISIPADSKNTHYEGELVIVIGKHGSKLSATQAKDAIFGVTCGNDVSERDWQGGPAKDLQWWRAKGSDTFGPCGFGNRSRLGLQQPATAYSIEWQGSARAVDVRLDFRLPYHRSIYQYLCNVAAWRSDLHRHTREHSEDESRRYRRGRHRRHRRTSQPCYDR